MVDIRVLNLECKILTKVLASAYITSYVTNLLKEKQKKPKTKQVTSNMVEPIQNVSVLSISHLKKAYYEVTQTPFSSSSYFELSFFFF